MPRRRGGWFPNSIGFNGFGNLFNNGFGTKWGFNQRNQPSTSNKRKEKRAKKRKRSRNVLENAPFSQNDVTWLGDLVGASPFDIGANYIIGDDDDDDLPSVIDLSQDAVKDEVLFGNVKGDIVGIQYYNGTVNNGEMVTLEREPNNRYDPNAIRTLNMNLQQVGHIKRELAKPLAYILDHQLGRAEGVVPSGGNNTFKMPIEISIWGLVEKKNEALSVLRSHSINVTDITSNQASTSNKVTSLDYSHVVSNRVYLSPGEVRNELDKLFDSLEEGDKTTTAEPTQAIKTTLYPHQKQALNWMICKENNEALPPFWEKRRGKYFNSLTIFTSSQKPSTVHGGILADDMGLGKTLEVISLILTNFRDSSPLAIPVPGKKRFSKSKPTLKAKKPGKKTDSQKNVCTENQSEWDKYNQCLISPETYMDDSEEEREMKAKNLKLFQSKVPKFNMCPATSSKGSDKDDSDINITSSAKLCSTKTISDDEFEEDISSLLTVNCAKSTIPCAKDNSDINTTSSANVCSNPIFDIKTIGDEFKEVPNIDIHEEIVTINDAAYIVPSITENPDIKKISSAIPDSDIITISDESNESIKMDTDDVNNNNSVLTSIQNVENSSNKSVKGQKQGRLKKAVDQNYEPKKLVKAKSLPVPINTGRPRRNAKKPARYVDLDSVEETEPPAKKARHNSMPAIKLKEGPVTSSAPPVKSSAPPVKSSAAPVTSLAPVTSSPVPVTSSVVALYVPHLTHVLDNLYKTIPSEEEKTISENGKTISGKGKTISGKGKGKGKGKMPKKSTKKGKEMFDDSSAPTTGLSADLEQSQVKTVTISDDEYVPSDNSSVDDDDDDDDDDWLPDLEIPFNCNKAAFSNCDDTTGRTKSDQPRTTLIICPLSVMNNWVSQLEEHVHDDVHLEIYTFYGTSRTTDCKLIENQDIVISTYGTVATDFKKKRTLQKVNWLRIILDEGHYIRNSKTCMAQAVIGLKAERRWVLTGTPIQNSIKDLFSLVNFLQISPLTEQVWWNRTIERPIAQGQQTAIKRVQALMANIALRRTKTQQVNGKALVELPARNVFIETIALTEEERKVYTAMQTEGKLIISRFFQQGTLLHHYSQVLVILLRLRQLCCHPLLCSKAALGVRRAMDLLGINIDDNDKDTNGGVPAIDDETKKKLIDALMAVLHSGSDEECSICLDSLKEPVITPCAHVYCRICIDQVLNADNINAVCPLCRGAINREKLIEIPPENPETEEEPIVTDKNWQSSSKVDALMKALVNQRSTDPTVKSIVVSQFTSLLTLVEVPLKLNGFKFARLDGTMSNKKRIHNIEMFMDPSPDSPTIFLLSLKAGGVGLNLTAASRVYLLDPAWNPAAEEQCFDRCHRLGQTRDVIITKFVVDESVEQRMLALQDRKRELMKGAFGKKQTADERRANRVNDIKTLLDL